MGLKQGLAGIQLDQDASDAPQIARVGPAQAQDDLRGSVMAGGNDGGMVLLFKSGAAKVDQLDSV